MTDFPSPSRVESLMRKSILATRPYTPILPPETPGKDIDDFIKLDGNENPYGCSPRVRQALSHFRHYHIYPDPDQRRLRRALQEYTGLGEEYIVGGAGSDELIDVVLRLFLESGDRVVNCPPTFGMYPFCTGVCGGTVLEVARQVDFSLDMAGIIAAAERPSKVIFIASPNNPTGNTVPREDILKLLETGLVTVIDEAYYEFSGETVAPLVEEYDNLIVLRSFSKWAGLAGLRVGYGLFPPRLAPYAMKIKQPYNINAAAEVAVLETFRDMDYMKGTVRAIIQERERFFAMLSGLSWLTPYPSRGNFILCRVGQGSARRLWQELQDQGVLLRYFDTPLLRDCVRISVGKPEQTDKVIKLLKEWGNAS